MKNKSDDRRDNVQKIQKHIDTTKQNMEAAEEMIASTDNEKVKKDLKEKNDRRNDAVHAFKSELRDESTVQKSWRD